MLEANPINEENPSASIDLQQDLIPFLPAAYHPPFHYLSNQDGVITLLATYQGELSEYFNLPVQLNICNTAQCAPEKQVRFFSTADWLSLLSNPHIISVIERGILKTNNGREFPFYTTEYCDGGTLQNCLDRVKQQICYLDINHVFWLFEQIVDAIAYLHQVTKEFHGMLSPSCFSFNAIGHLKLTDLGWITPGNWEWDYCNSQKIPLSKIVPNFSYIAFTPKQYRLDETLDVASLGLICYTMLTGKILLLQQMSIFEVLHSLEAIDDKQAYLILRKTLPLQSVHWSMKDLKSYIHSPTLSNHLGVPTLLHQKIIFWCNRRFFCKWKISPIPPNSVNKNSAQDWPSVIWKKLSVIEAIPNTQLAHILKIYWQRLRPKELYDLVRSILNQSSKKTLARLVHTLINFGDAVLLQEIVLHLAYSAKYNLFLVMLWEKYPTHAIIHTILEKYLPYPNSPEHILNILVKVKLGKDAPLAYNTLYNKTQYDLSDLPLLACGIQSTFLDVSQFCADALVKIAKADGPPTQNTPVAIFDSNIDTESPTQAAGQSNIQAASQSNTQAAGQPNTQAAGQPNTQTNKDLSSDSASSINILRSEIVWLLAFSAQSANDDVALINIKAIAQLGPLAQDIILVLSDLLEKETNVQICIATANALEKIGIKNETAATMVSTRLEKETNQECKRAYIHTLGAIATGNILVLAVMNCLKNWPSDITASVLLSNCCEQSLYNGILNDSSVLFEILKIFTKVSEHQSIPLSGPIQALMSAVEIRKLSLCLNIFARMGSTARPIIPHIGNALKRLEGDIGKQCLEVLVKIDPSGQQIIPIIVEALLRQDVTIKKIATKILYQLHFIPTNQDEVIALALGQENISPLITIGPPALKNLLQAIKNPGYSTPFQVACVDAISQFISPSFVVVPTLINIFTESRTPICIACAKALSKFGESAQNAIPHLAKQLEEGDSAELRAACAVALGKIAVQNISIARVLLKAGSDDYDKTVRTTCIKVFADMSVACPKLTAEILPSIETKGIWYYREYIHIFRKIGPQHIELLPTLLNYIEQKSLHISIYIKLIGQIGPVAGNAIPILAKLFEDSWKNFHLKLSYSCAQTLCKLNWTPPAYLQYPLWLMSKNWPALILAGAPAVRFLITGLQTQDITMRLGCARTLGLMGPDAKNAVPLLISYVEQGSHRLQFACVQALARIGKSSKEAVPILQKKLQSGRKKFVWLCKRAIDEIEKSKD